MVSLCSSMYLLIIFVVFFFFKQKTAYEMRISDWSSDVCSSDLFAQRYDRRVRPNSRESEKISQDGHRSAAQSQHQRDAVAHGDDDRGDGAGARHAAVLRPRRDFRLHRGDAVRRVLRRLLVLASVYAVFVLSSVRPGEFAATGY